MSAHSRPLDHFEIFWSIGKPMTKNFESDLRSGEESFGVPVGTCEACGGDVPYHKHRYLSLEEYLDIIEKDGWLYCEDCHRMCEEWYYEEIKKSGGAY